MRTILIVCSILLILILTLAGKYFTDLAGKTNTLEKVLNLVPEDAALVLAFKNNPSFYEIFKDYPLFDAVIGENKAKELTKLRDLINQTLISEAVNDRDVIISLHYTPDSVEFLYSVSLDNAYSDGDLGEIISRDNRITVKKSPENYYQIDREGSKPLYLFMQKGVAIASFSQRLIKRSKDSNSPHLPARFVEAISKESSKNLNSPIYLFVNHVALARFAAHFTNESVDGNLALLDSLSGISTLSMNFKSDALMFNGLSNTDSVSPGYLNLFLHQHAIRNSLKKIAPKNTANYLAFGAANNFRFRDDLRKYFDKRNALKKLQDMVRDIKVNSGVDTDRDLMPLFDDEFITIETSEGEKLAIVEALNGRNLNFKLQLISTPVSAAISKLNYSNVFYYYFGDPLRQFVKPYFAVVDNYLIISNSSKTVNNYLTTYNVEDFLAATDEFKRFDQLVANQSNISFFINVSNSQRAMKSVLKPKYNDINRRTALNKFYGLSFQWTSEKNHFFTNLYLSYNSSDSSYVND